jgi:Protein of unknown function (DUF3618)
MGQTTDQITADIQRTRAKLRSNLEELEYKVKSVTDWKQYFQKRPGTMMAVVFGVSAVIASASVRKRRATASWHGN